MSGNAWRCLGQLGEICKFVPLCDLSERLEEIACQAVEVMRPYFGETLPQIQVVLTGEGTLRHHQNPVQPCCHGHDRDRRRTGDGCRTR